MQLYEEYLDRHDVGTKVLHHVKRGSLFLKLPFEDPKKAKRATKKKSSMGHHWSPMPRNSTRWNVITVEWNHEPTYHPGKYYCNIMAPRHDSANRRNCTFDVIVERKIVHYDEWDSYWANWLKGTAKQTVVHGKDEVLLAAWEMFVFCNDTYFSRRPYEDKLFRSIDSELSVEDRKSAFSEVRELMACKERDSEVLSKWQHDFEMSHLQNYLHWLADLVVRDDAEKQILTGSSC